MSRDIYRPDMQCVRVEDQRQSINCNLFYYQDVDVEIANNQLCIYFIRRREKK